MGLFDDLLKNVDTEKIKKSFSDIAEQVKNIDTSELKNAMNKLADALPEDMKKELKESAPKPEVKVDEKALEAAQAKTDVSYATADYTGIDREDYDEELPEDFLPAKGKIMEVLEADFKDYEIFEDVSPTLIGGTGNFLDYSIGVYKDGVPKLFIMLINNKNYRLRTYRWSKEQAEKAGIPMINFIENAPNRYWYISERLHKYL